MIAAVTPKRQATIRVIEAMKQASPYRVMKELKPPGAPSFGGVLLLTRSWLRWSEVSRRRRVTNPRLPATNLPSAAAAQRDQDDEPGWLTSPVAPTMYPADPSPAFSSPRRDSLCQAVHASCPNG
jgi:hypothetical protein